MKMRLLLLLAGVAGLLPMAGCQPTEAAGGWYPQLVQADFVKNYAVVPKVDGVMIIDSRQQLASTTRATSRPRSTSRTPSSTR